MRIERCAPTVLAAVFLGFAGCDGEPLDPRAGAAEPVPQFAKVVFERCKPHVNVGVQPQQGEPEMVVVASQQSIDADPRDDSRADGQFVAQLRTWDNGVACGQAWLEIEQAYEAGGAGVLQIVLIFTRATGQRDAGSLGVAFEGTARICAEREDVCRTEEMTGTVHRHDGDRAIWQFHAAGVRSFHARTRFVRPGPASGSVRGVFPDQEVVVHGIRGTGGPRLFHAEFEVESTGVAFGGIRIVDISNPSGPQVRFEVLEGRFTVSPDGVVAVGLSGLVDVGAEDRFEERGAFSATLSRLPDGRTRWQFQGPGLSGGPFDASGGLEYSDQWKDAG